jgi:hypothetical protein
VIWWEPCQDAANKTFEIDGAELLGIEIDPCMMALKRTTKLPLIHEMVDVKTGPQVNRLKDPGDVFDAAIQRLTTFRSCRKLL